METRAHHLLIGLFTIVAVVTGFLVVLWLGKIEIDQEYVYYDILFQDAVTGLNEGAEVRYQGIAVGNVTRIRIDEKSHGKVRVTVRLSSRSDVQVRDSARASLELQGLTGLSYILITPKGPGGEVLPQVHDPDAERPAILSERSQLQSLFSNLPGVLKSADGFLRKLQNVVSDENTKNISHIIADIEKLTNTLAERQADIDKAVTNMATISDEVVTTLQQASELAKRLTSLSADIEKLVDENAQQTLNTINNTAGSIAVLSKDVSRVIRTNEDSIQAFTSQGLAQTGVLVQEIRELVDNLNHLTRSIEDDPSSFIFGGRQPEEIKPDDDD